MIARRLMILVCTWAAFCTAAHAWTAHSAPQIVPQTSHVSHGSGGHSGHPWGSSHGHGYGGHPYFGLGIYGAWPWFYPGYAADFSGYGLPVYADSFYSQAPAPVQYVDMAPPAVSGAKAAPGNAWYYCKNPEGYYPYVKACDYAWEVVPAQPPVQ